jgi:hypothetical protein
VLTADFDVVSASRQHRRLREAQDSKFLRDRQPIANQAVLASSGALVTPSLAQQPATSTLRPLSSIFAVCTLNPQLGTHNPLTLQQLGTFAFNLAPSQKPDVFATEAEH